MTPIIHRRVAGFSLIEVLISLIILSVGLLGIAAMVSESLKSKDSSYYRSQALDYAAAIVDRMRANRAMATANAYDVNFGGTGSNAGAPADNCTTTKCSSSQLASVDLAEWQNDIGNALPGFSNGTLASGEVSTVTVGQMTQVNVTVQWNDARASSAVASAASAAAPGAVTSIGSVTITSGL